MSRKLTLVKQRGLTLVELMIGLVLSLMLMAGVLAIFSSTKQTYTLQESVSRVQEDGYAALELLRQQIVLAGYPEDTLLLKSGMIGTNPSGGTYPAAITPAFTVSASDGSSFIYQFLAPYDDFMNCAGDAPFSEGDVVVLRIGLASGWLVCEGSTTSTQVIDNVSNLQFAYRENGQNSYTTSIDDARNVIAVRVSFDVSTPTAPIVSRTFTATFSMRNQVH